MALAPRAQRLALSRVNLRKFVCVLGSFFSLFYLLSPLSSPLFPVTVLLLPACGRKTPVRPPELVAPEPIEDLTGEVESQGIQLRWSRPQKHVYGGDLDDLGGFVILRAVQNGDGKAGPFTQLATVMVADQDRFRQAKKFSYTDKQLAVDSHYRYRVQAFTLDGYYSSPSNTVALVWKGGS